LPGSGSGWAVPPCRCAPCTAGSARSPAGRRPRLVAKGDPDHDQVLAALRLTIAALPEGAVVLAEDETHLNLLALGARHLDPHRAAAAGPHPGTNRRRTIFGAIDVASGRFFYQAARKAVSATFIAFLAQLAAAYPAAPVVAVICDNVIIHHAKIVQRWLAAHPRGDRAARGPLQPPRQPGRAGLGRAQGMAGQLTDPDHSRTPPPSCTSSCRAPATRPPCTRWRGPNPKPAASWTCRAGGPRRLRPARPGADPGRRPGPGVLYWRGGQPPASTSR
jgi:hypothetical protein